MVTSLGFKLRYFRKLCRFTQQSISETLGIDRTTYSNYERDISQPNADTCITLAKIFGISVGELMGEEKSTVQFFHDINSRAEEAPPDLQDIPLRLGELTKEERRLICLFRAVSAEQQDDLLSKADDYIKDNLKSNP